MAYPSVKGTKLYLSERDRIRTKDIKSTYAKYVLQQYRGFWKGWVVLSEIYFSTFESSYRYTGGGGDKSIISEKTEFLIKTLKASTNKKIAEENEAKSKKTPIYLMSDKEIKQIN